MASYYVWSAAAGSANGTSWANAYTTLTSAFSGKAAGDVFYVAHDHAQTAATFVTLASPGTVLAPVKVICVDRAGTVPPVSADRRATAQVTTTSGSGSNLEISGFTHYDGIIFNCGTGTGSSAIHIPYANGHCLRFDNCSLKLVNTAANSTININNPSTATAGSAFLNNTTMSFANASQFVNVAGGMLEWRNTPSALLGTIPTILFQQAASKGGKVECVGVDFSAAGSGKTIVGMATTAQAQSYRFVDCKLDAAVTKVTTPTIIGSADYDFVRSGAAGVSYAVHRQRVQATLIEETTIVRTGGASDGTTPIAWKIVTTASCSYSLPFEAPPIAIWNDTTGSAKTATVECIAAAIMTDQEIWLELEYLGDASSPQGSFVSDAKADLLATAANQTSSSATWGGSTAPFKLAVTFTAQQRGWIYARVKVGKASSTVYVDPLVTLS